jgi:vesicle coat complex subunit
LIGQDPYVRKMATVSVATKADSLLYDWLLICCSLIGQDEDPYVRQTAAVSVATKPNFLLYDWLFIYWLVIGQDEDPYVRKTAAVSVAKLHDINSSLVEEQGFLDSLKVGRFIF